MAASSGSPKGGPDSVASLAHIAPDRREHRLDKHLQGVAARAREFAQRLSAAELGYQVGLWHDLGKYSGTFQRIIRNENGITAHIEGFTDGERDHSTAGAIHCVERLGKAGMLAAFAIAGHHAGLADEADLRHRLAPGNQAKRDLYRDVLARAEPAIRDALHTVELPPQVAGGSGPNRRLIELWTRLVFSALCDADFLDTEAFFDADRASNRGCEVTLPALVQCLDTHMQAIEAGAIESEVNRVRAEVRAACVQQAMQPPGVFSLTVPTGGGKTLAGLSFALHHAIANQQRRVIVAIPFTSIIEQTADVYRRVFAHLGNGVLLEHHSNLDPKKDTPKNRVASENWDAPLVITTTVQLFESLFANRPGACRKLHRIAGSVLVLDEAQTLPPHLLHPILDVLKMLVQHFGVSVVFATATQPVFQETSLPRVGEEALGFVAVREIIPTELRAFERLRRVQVHWPDPLEPTTWSELAQSICDELDVLAIVHRRQDARDLCNELDARLGQPGTLHLSALMCPEHRSQILRQIKLRKQAGQPVRLVSTQLVEAGVDLDFAVVYRALGGLDSIAQAAGRCNREGRLPGLGKLHVFVAPTQPPKGVPITALSITKGMLRAGAVDLDDRQSFSTFFRRLYGTIPSPDQKGVQALREALKFREVARTFTLIEDGWSAPLLVPYQSPDEAEEQGHAHRLLQTLRSIGPTRELLRGLQRYTISVPAAARDAWLSAGFLEWVADTVVALKWEFRTAYDSRFGLCADRMGVASPESLIG